MLQVNNISKQYGETQALKEVRFAVRKGEIFGLIGPDGAGKTTLFEILATLLKPDSGEALIEGMNVATEFNKIRPLLGYMPGSFSLYGDLTVEENLTFYSEIYHTKVEDHMELIADLYEQLVDFSGRRAENLSGGMKQKLALCCVLIHEPELLLLDEPTTGVDPVARADFWDILHRLKEKDIAILVSTPFMEEARQCDRVGLLHKGSILDIDRPEDLSGKFDRELYALSTQGNMFNLIRSLRKFPQSRTVWSFGDAVHLTFKTENADIESLRSYLNEEKITSYEIEEITPGIEDQFMEYIRNYAE